MTPARDKNTEEDIGTSDLIALKGGKAFPDGFDPWQIADRSRRRRKRIRSGAFITTFTMFLALVFVDLDSFLADYHSPVGEVTQVTLPDGTRVTMDSDTFLQWQESSDERQVQITGGRALFETAKGDKRPFIVATDSLYARPMGTVFSVSNLADHQRVSVESGQVEVRLAGQGEVTMLPAGRTAYVRAGELVVERADPDTQHSWKSGLLEFSQAKPADVIKMLDRYRKGRIILMSDEDTGQLFDGILSIQDIDQSLELFLDQTELEIVTSSDFLTLIR